MNKFKYFGTVKVANLRYLLFAIYFYSFQNFIRHLENDYSVFLNSVIGFLTLVIPYFLVPKIAKKLSLGYTFIDLSGEIFKLPKKYYWAKDVLVEVSFKSILYTYQISKIYKKGINIYFKDASDNITSIFLEEVFF